MLGTSIFPYDSFLNAGILEWVRRALLSNASVFDWNAGFPLANSLAVGENLLGWQIFYLPLRAFGVGIPGAYNVLILLSLVISGVSAALLARRLGASRAGGALAGLVFAYGPFHLSHILHIQSQAVCWTPLAILFLDRYLEKRSLGDLVGLSATIAIIALSALYFAVFTAIVLPLYAILCWICGRYRFDRRALRDLLVTAGLVIVAVSPVLIHYIRFHGEVGYKHDVDVLANFSMEAAAPLRVPEWMMSWAWTPMVRHANWRAALSFSPAFPGIVVSLLAIYAMIASRGNKASRTVVVILVSLAVICYLLALGPILKPVNFGYSSVRRLPMPGKIWLVIPGIRWPMRIFFFAWLAAAVLSALGLTALQRSTNPPRSRIIASVVIALVVLEFWPARWYSGKSVLAPEPMSMSDAYPFLSAEPDRGGVIEIPTSDPTGWRTPFSTRYIYASLGHLRKIVATHGSVVAPATDSLLRAANALPDSSSMNMLAHKGVTRVVIHRELLTKDSAQKLVSAIQSEGYPVLFAGSDGVVFGTTRSPVPAGR